MNDKEIKKYFCISKSYIITLLTSLLISVILFVLKDYNKYFLFISFISFFIFMIYMIKFLIKFIIIKKFDKKYYRDKILVDIRKASILKYINKNNYFSPGMILTDKYLISLFNLRVIYYSDIVWIYGNSVLYPNSQNSPISLIVALENGKSYCVYECYGKIDNSDTINDIINYIKERNKKVITGFSKENKKKYNDIISNN